MLTKAHQNSLERPFFDVGKQSLTCSELQTELLDVAHVINSRLFGSVHAYFSQSDTLLDKTAGLGINLP